MNKLKWVAISAIFLFASCKSHLTTEKTKPQVVKNLESKTPMLFRCMDTFPEKFWIGDYLTVTDSIGNIDHNNIQRENWIAIRRTLRFGKWLLKDEQGTVYAEAFYQNDTLKSFKHYANYPESCNMDSMKEFSRRDTAWVTIIY